MAAVDFLNTAINLPNIANSIIKKQITFADFWATAKPGAGGYITVANFTSATDSMLQQMEKINDKNIARIASILKLTDSSSFDIFPSFLLWYQIV